ncbi:MAG TPA: GC-type dockerin domain-anchored protein [Phycisphaerales bacterium]|nr:GC-type dockerin domain-anchored protein [Phycisphaerales bacterium]
MRFATFFGGVASLALVAGASAQWSENFDSYADGTVLDGVGGWEGWDGVGDVAGTVTNDRARSNPNSIVVTSDDDAIHPFSGYTSGQWTFTAYQYVPSGLDAATYFLLQNVYNHGGPYDWGVQLVFDPSTDEVHDDMQDFYGSGSNYLPAIYDQWVEIRVEIDLDANFVETFYNDELVSSGDWDTNLDGDIAIANVDLYAPHAGSVYYDDLSLRSAGGGCIGDFDGNGVVDTRDVIAFLNAWNAGDASSDCDGNGVIDTRDVICFLNAWNAGC